jgi:hypothetical protein
VIKRLRRLFNRWVLRRCCGCGHSRNLHVNVADEWWCVGGAGPSASGRCNCKGYWL